MFPDRIRRRRLVVRASVPPLPLRRFRDPQRLSFHPLLPWANRASSQAIPRLGQRVEQGQQFAHAGRHRDLERFAALHEFQLVAMDRLQLQQLSSAGDEHVEFGLFFRDFLGRARRGNMRIGHGLVPTLRIRARGLRSCLDGLLPAAALAAVRADNHRRGGITLGFGFGNTEGCSISAAPLPQTPRGVLGRLVHYRN